MTEKHILIPETALEWHRAGRKVALATVIKTWGSAPRPVGSQLVIDAEQVLDGCVEIVNLDGILRNVVGEIVRRPISDAGLDASARHPDGKVAGMMVASVIVRL